MNKLKERELLEWLKENIDRYAFLQISHPHLAYYATERDKQAYQQIKEMIRVEKKKLFVTKEFVEKMVDESVYVLHEDMGEFYKNKFKEVGAKVMKK